VFLKTVVDSWHNDDTARNLPRRGSTDFTWTKPIDLKRHVRAVLLGATYRNQDDTLLRYNLLDFGPREIGIEYLVNSRQEYRR